MAKVKKSAKSQNQNQEASLEKDDAQRNLENQLKRALADYQNLERRVSEERQLLSGLTSAIVVEKFLPVLDNLESAQSHLNDEGLGLVIKQFKDVLTSEGVEEIGVEVADPEQGRSGQEFDPHLHEAVEVVESQSGSAIVKVVAKGYKINDRVIRPAKVVVSRKPEADKPVSQNQEGGTVVNSSPD